MKVFILITGISYLMKSTITIDKQIEKQLTGELK